MTQNLNPNDQIQKPSKSKEVIDLTSTSDITRITTPVANPFIKQTGDMVFPSPQKPP